MDKQHSNSLVLHYFLVFFLIAILLLGRLLWPFVSIIILSYLLATIFEPIYKLLNRRFSDSFSSLVTCVLIITLVFIPLIFFVGALSSEAFSLFQYTKETNWVLKVREYTEHSAILGKIEDILALFGFHIELKLGQFSQLFSDFVKVAGHFIYSQASSWAANILSFVFNFVMMILIIFFLLIDRQRLLEYLLNLSPLPDAQDKRLINKFEKIAKAIMVGNGICGLIQGVLGGLIFVVFDFGSPLLWGGIMGILAFLPIFGIGLVLIPAALYLFINSNISGGIIMIIFYLIISFTIEYIFKPKLVGGQVRMPTLLVFLSIMGGLSVFGFLGIIYGPLIAACFLTLAEIYQEHYRPALLDE
jgi:predicted PurR-regulated permease PerM